MTTHTIQQSPQQSRFSLAVFCGARSGNDAKYVALTQRIGQWLGQQQAELVYGGGTQGLMGTVARASLDSGARVYGVIPEKLVALEGGFTQAHELHRVQTMHERKAMMSDRADAFLIIPGGIGTLEEFYEVWAGKQLGFHNKPIVLLNLDGYYDRLLQFNTESISKGFMRDAQLDLLHVHTTLEAALEDLLLQLTSAKQ